MSVQKHTKTSTETFLIWQTSLIYNNAHKQRTFKQRRDLTHLLWLRTQPWRLERCCPCGSPSRWVRCLQPTCPVFTPAVHSPVLDGGGLWHERGQNAAVCSHLWTYLVTNYNFCKIIQVISTELCKTAGHTPKFFTPDCQTLAKLLMNDKPGEPYRPEEVHVLLPYLLNWFSARISHNQKIVRLGPESVFLTFLPQRESKPNLSIVIRLGDTGHTPHHISRRCCCLTII